MFRRSNDELYDAIPLWAWFLILPGIVIVTTLIIRRLSSEPRWPGAVTSEAEEIRLTDSTREPQSAEQTHFAVEAEDTGEKAGPVERMVVMDAAGEAAAVAEMQKSTVEEEVQVAEAASDSEETEDDLKIIEGIGPKIEALLKNAGITTFKQLANTRVERLYEILHSVNLHMADPNTWPEQARLAANGNWDFLKALQDRTHAGRRSIED